MIRTHDATPSFPTMDYATGCSFAASEWEIRIALLIAYRTMREARRA